jgi:hypothetical protein
MKKVGLFLSLGLLAGGLWAQSFVDVAGDVGLTLDHSVGTICEPPISSGSAWGDFDGDDDVDLFVTQHGGANRLYENVGDTGVDGLPDFIEVAASFGIDAPSEVSIGAVFIDYDNDGDQDLYVTNWSGNTLWQNQLVETGSVAFVDVSAAAGLVDDGRAITTAWGDFDGDGNLDVYLAKHRLCNGDEQSADRLMQNNGDGTFSDVTAWLCEGCPQIETSLSFAPVFVDYDNDKDLDIYVVRDAIAPMNSENVLWQNDGPDELNPGQWLFSDVSEASGSNTRLNGMGLGVGDIDNDGNYDFAFSNIGANVLLHNQGDGTFDDISASAGIERRNLPGGGVSITWGTEFIDYDNDQLQDLYIVAGNIQDLPDPVQFNILFKNNGDLTFDNVSVASGLDNSLRARNTGQVDFDRDGWMDLFDANFGYPPTLYHNQNGALGVQAGWLQVTVEGTVDNRDGIGTRIFATTANGVTQMQDINTGAAHGGGHERVAHFGLDDQTEADLTVRWPNGAEQDLGTFAANQRIHVSQDLVLGDPDPGVIGVPNQIVVTGGEPGKPAILAMGLGIGTRPIPQCPGVLLDIMSARKMDIKNADDLGVATLDAPAPPFLAGRTVYYQVYEPQSCRVSNRVEFTFP